MPCEQFLNSFISKFYKGGGKLEKSVKLVTMQKFFYVMTTYNFFFKN